MEIQTKIAVTFTLVCTSIILALSIAVYHFANQNAFKDFYTRLQLRATITAKANLEKTNGNTNAYEQVRNRDIQQLPEEKEYIVPIDSLQEFSKSKLAGGLPPVFFNDLISFGNASYRKGYQFFKGLYYKNNSRAYAIIISAHHRDAQNFLANLKTILVATNLIATIVVFTLGIVFSRQILAPIRNISRQVNNINATSLHKRLTIKEGKDEITELANTYNNMLGRLETSFETQNNFVSNASHEFNTPLTAIIGESELLLSRKRSPEQYEQGLKVILLQAEKLKNLTKSLLELAQSGFTGNLSFETVEVNELLRSVEKVAYSIYPQCPVGIDYSLQPENISQLTISGNFHLLELSISNIVLNACKYSSGAGVTLAIATTEKHVIFMIKDKGIGIPEKDMPFIFDPFFRASNAKGSKGYGIGLPLAQNIIKLHKGFIDVSSKESEGTEVLVKIPKADR